MSDTKEKQGSAAGTDGGRRPRRLHKHPLENGPRPAPQTPEPVGADNRGHCAQALIPSRLELIPDGVL